MIDQIKNLIPTECPWRDTLYWYETIDSTNTRAKEMAHGGAPHGTVLIAGHQSAGRGRMGRSFHSPQNKGLYLSVILRPDCTPDKLMHLTCAVGVAVCDAVENATGFRPGIKWINDLIADNKKLGGILTELSMDAASGKVAYAIVGIGINRSHTEADFPPELQSIATSLSMTCGHEIASAKLAASVVIALQNMDSHLLSCQTQLLEQYAKDCITIGKEVAVLRGDERSYGKAVGLDKEGALLVDFNGTVEPVNSGEASVRGMYGYV